MLLLDSPLFPLCPPATPTISNRVFGSWIMGRGIMEGTCYVSQRLMAAVATAARQLETEGYGARYLFRAESPALEILCLVGVLGQDS